MEALGNEDNNKIEVFLNVIYLHMGNSVLFYLKMLVIIRFIDFTATNGL